MSLLRTLQVGQLGALLRERNLPEIYEGWTQWGQYIAFNINNEGYGGPEHRPQELNHWPMAPAGYLLAFTAAVCEREQENPDLNLDAVGAVYLDGIFEDTATRTWRSLLGLILPRQGTEVCWQRILNYVQEWEDIGTQSSVSDLLERILQANEEARQQGQEFRIPEESISNLTHVFDHWAATCENMLRQLDHQPLLQNNPIYRTLCGMIENGVKQIILTGAPGTGKTYMARLAAQSLGTPLDGTPCMLVPFHPSYDYTDFVEGLRPMQLAQRDGVFEPVEFVRLDGTFKDFCRKVAASNRTHTGDSTGVDDPDRRYFFLIDEINRADLSKVFGELMLCLESDKRGVAVQTQYRGLTTYSPDTRAPLEEDLFASGFFVPKNVIIIGTMNDIDRSVESMDFALRRRFAWLELEVTQELLENAFRTSSFCPVLNNRAEEAARRVMALNDVISSLPEEAGRGVHTGWGERHNLSRHYYISQGQFAGLPDPLPREDGDNGDELDVLLRFVWTHRLHSLLREYVRGVEEQAETDFLTRCRNALLEG